MLLLRSLLFNLLMLLSVLVYVPLALLTFPFPHKSRYRFISGWARMQMWLVRLLCGIRYRVEGREHLPKGAGDHPRQAPVGVGNARFQELFPMQTWVLKRELLWIPFFRLGPGAHEADRH